MFSLNDPVDADVCFDCLVCFTGISAGGAISVFGASCLLARARSGAGFTMADLSRVLARTRPLRRWCFSSSKSPLGFCRVTRRAGSWDCGFAGCAVESARSSCSLFRFCGGIFRIQCGNHGPTTTKIKILNIPRLVVAWVQDVEKLLLQ